MINFIVQLIALLVIAVSVLALMSAFGIGQPATDGLAILFGFVICILVLIILVFVSGIIMKMIANAGAGQSPSNLPFVDDTRTDEVLLPDQHNAYHNRAKHDDAVQRALDSQGTNFDIEPEDTGA